MLFSQSEGTFFVAVVCDDPVSFCICWKNMFKGKQKSWFTLSSEADPCFLWMWQERGLTPTPSWQIWGLGWGQQLPGGIFGMGGAAGTQEGSTFPLGFPGAGTLSSQQEFPGAQWGSQPSLVCRIQAWNFLLHQNWLEWSGGALEL